MPTDTPARRPKPDRVRGLTQPYPVGTVLVVTYAARVPGLTSPLSPREPVRVRGVIRPADGKPGPIRYEVQRQATTAGSRRVTCTGPDRFAGDLVTLPGYYLLPAGL